MIIVKLKLDAKLRKKFKTYNIDKRKLENVLILMVNNVVSTRKWWNYNIKAKGISGADSQYFWGEDQIEIALMGYGCKNAKQRRLYLLKSIAHEYRHWVQSQILKVSERKINYTEEDIENHTDSYMKNKYELECSEWEELIERFNDLI